MVNMMFPKYLLLTMDEMFNIISNIDSRITPAELVHDKLDVVKEYLRKMIDHREEFLKEENSSAMNLSTIVHSRTLSVDNKVIIKMHGVVLLISPAYGVEIKNNFNPYNYSINKVGKTQELQYAHEDDARFHFLVYKFKSTNGKYQYRVGNRIELKPYGGTYKIVSIDADYAMITCKKWQNEGKRNRQIKVSDIKCLATNKFNSLSYGS